MAFIIEAGEGPIPVTAAGSGGVGAVADADRTDSMSWFPKREVGPHGLSGIEHSPPERFVERAGRFAPGWPNPERDTLTFRCNG